jgi:uncharacterized protein YbaR (Trm112 family)
MNDPRFTEFLERLAMLPITKEHRVAVLLAQIAHDLLKKDAASEQQPLAGIEQIITCPNCKEAGWMRKSGQACPICETRGFLVIDSKKTMKQPSLPKPRKRRDEQENK